MTTPITTQSPAMQGMSTQQGLTPGFPAPLGVENYLGQPSLSGGFTPLVSQLLPIAQQVILPAVMATAIEQIQVYLYQLVAQQVSQYGQQGGQQSPFGQQPPFGQQGWQQPQFGQHSPFGQQFGGQQPYLSPYTGWQLPPFGQHSPFGQQSPFGHQGHGPFGRSYQGSF
jgi:hypothetical protein